MKLLFFALTLLALCVIVMSSVPRATAQECMCITCSDTDGGIDQYTQGTVVSFGASYTDRCVLGNLLEYYCEKGLVKSSNIICIAGCFRGKCNPPIP